VADADEPEDPLFDSTRGYVEQIDRYKQQQGQAADEEGGELMGRHARVSHETTRAPQ
jgi:hypothetical protein